MTDITREFNASTRALTKVERRYAGQALDSLSTTIHFVYNPINFLSGSSDTGTEGYVPYIMFNVFDSNGNPLIYSLNSTPVFDGYTFTIPWDVTSRVKTMSLEYQLYFIKNNVTIDDIRNVAQLDSTEYLISAMDSIALKPTIKCKPAFPNPACCPSAPTTEPGIMGYINLFRDYGVMVPISAEVDQTQNRLVLTFPTYNGTNDQRLPLEVPYLVDGLIPIEFLNVIEQWGEQSNLNLPTALLVYSSLMEKTDKTMAIAPWESNLTYDIGSTVIGSDGRIYRSVQQSNIGNDPTGDSGLWSEVMEYDAIVNQWEQEPSDVKVPSEQLVKSSLDEKTDILLAIPFWDSGTIYQQGSSVLYESTIYISLQNGNQDNLPGDDDTWWLPVQGGGERDQYDTFVEAIGDGTSTQFTVTHGFGTEDVFVQLRMADGSGLYVESQIEVLDANSIQVSFTSPPAMSDVVVLVSPAMTTKRSFVQVIGDGVNTQFTLNHYLGKYNFFSQVMTTTSPREVVDATIMAVSPSQAVITFTSPPPVGGVVVMLSPMIGNMDDTAEFVYTQVEPSAEWVIQHNFGRYVSVYLMDMDGNEMGGLPQQDMGSLDKVTILFSEPVSGYALFR